MAMLADEMRSYVSVDRWEDVIKKSVEACSIGPPSKVGHEPDLRWQEGAFGAWRCRGA